MNINGIEFEIIVNVKKIKKIYMRIKTKNNINYFIINSYKKLSNREINDLIERNKEAINRLVNKMNINPLKDNEVLLLGKVYNKQLITQETIDQCFNKIIDLFNNYKIIFKKNDTILKFRKMKSRWGVCHITKNYITLTKYLIHLPLDLVEYIIVHEFSHFKHPNHSKKFYKLVSEYCPDYKIKIKEIKKYSFVLV